MRLEIVLLAWGVPVLAFFAASRPYLSAKGRIISAAVIWAYLYGVVGTILYDGPLGDVPPRFVVGLVHMAGGMGALEWIASRPALRSFARRLERFRPDWNRVEGDSGTGG